MLNKAERALCQKVLHAYFVSVATELNLNVRIEITNMRLSQNDTLGRFKLWTCQTDVAVDNEYLTNIPFVFKRHLASKGFIVIADWKWGKFKGPYGDIVKDFILVEFPVARAEAFISSAAESVLTLGTCM